MKDRWSREELLTPPTLAEVREARQSWIVVGRSHIGRYLFQMTYGSEAEARRWAKPDSAIFRLEVVEP